MKNMNKEVVLNGTTWKMDDLNNLEIELIENIARLDGKPKEVRRIANAVSSNLGKIRALIHAERYLEKHMGVKFVREVKK